MTILVCFSKVTVFIVELKKLSHLIVFILNSVLGKTIQYLRNVKF